MDLEGITRSETSQRENDKCHRTLLIFGIKKKKKPEMDSNTENTLMVAGRLGHGQKRGRGL